MILNEKTAFVFQEFIHYSARIYEQSSRNMLHNFYSISKIFSKNFIWTKKILGEILLKNFMNFTFLKNDENFINSTNRCMFFYCQSYPLKNAITNSDT